MIYFDNAATSPIRQRVIDRIVSSFQNHWGNPSSLHKKGFEAEKAMDRARSSIASFFDVEKKSILFTSGATESNNMAIEGTIRGKEKENIVLTRVEHSSIYEKARSLEGKIEVRYLKVDRQGRVDPKDLEKEVDEDTSLVCLIHVNNELGTIADLNMLSLIVKKKNPNCKLLVDGVQAFAKLPIDLSQPIDFYSASGHKIHGPKGIGLLYVKDPKSFRPLLYGGGQEFALRPGTENVAYMEGLEEALLAMQEDGKDPRDLYQYARDRVKEIPYHVFNSPEDGSPYILNVGFAGVKSELLLRFMEQEKMYLSSGSACNKGKKSRVLEAIGVEGNFIDGCIRISFSRDNRIEEAELFFDHMEQSIENIRKFMKFRG